MNGYRPVHTGPLAWVVGSLPAAALFQHRTRSTKNGRDQFDLTTAMRASELS